MSRSGIFFGLGKNDANYQVSVYEAVNGKQKQTWRCPFYAAWKGMFERCYSKKFHSLNKTYIGCSVDPEWYSFMGFRSWMIAQPWEGRQLDKDILFHGNKIYSPNTCVFVPMNLNLFMTDSMAARGKYPIGAYYLKCRSKFRANCANPFNGKNEYLGLFDCPNKAHEAWRAKKHEHACRYADMQTDPRIADALRSRYAKENWYGENKSP